MDKLAPSKNPFAVFAAVPEGVCFEAQEEGEKILLMLRAHPIVLVPAVLTVGFLLLLPFLLSRLLVLVSVDLSSVFSGSQLFLMTSFWFLFVCGFAFYKFIFWYFNVYMVTNERVIDFDFKGLLHKETAYAKLNQIQDVSPKMIGFFSTFFHYGNVFIQTAAERPEFEFHQVAKPDLVAQVILEQVRLEEAEKPGEIG